ALVIAHLFVLAAHPLGLLRQRFFEGSLLQTVQDGALVVRKGAIDRIAQHQQNLDIPDLLADLSRCMGTVVITRREFPRQQRTTADLQHPALKQRREKGAIVEQPLPDVSVEEVWLLEERGAERVMLTEIRRQRAR